MSLRRQMAEGFAVIVARRPLLRATVTSSVSYAGIGMLLVCCPLLGAQRLGGAARGALLISATAVASLAANAILAAGPGAGRPDTRVLASTLVIGASMAAAALAPGWLTLAAVALGGAGEGPQLTALLAVRHRETPAHLRGQVYTTAASLKIGGLAAGAALAGPLAGLVGNRLPADRGGHRAGRRGGLPHGRGHRLPAEYGGGLEGGDVAGGVPVVDRAPAVVLSPADFASAGAAKSPSFHPPSRRKHPSGRQAGPRRSSRLPPART